jgi:hypothetical protein
MAGVYFKASTGKQAYSTSTKTMIQIFAASNHRCKGVYFDVTCNGGSATDNTDLFEVLTQSTAGTGTSLTLQKYNSEDGETIQTTAARTHTVEPTAGNVIDSQLIHPFNGKHRFGPYVVPGGTRLGVRVNTSAVGANCNINVTGEE